MRSTPKHNSAGPTRTRLSNAIVTRAMMFLACCCLVPSLCHGQTGNVLCKDGDGKFKTDFVTGVSVSVGPATNGDLARRVCTATLTWDKQDLVVAPEASQVDIDLLGADLGFGAPVVAFQVKESSDSARMTYEIFSLQKPPRLLREITGGDYFRAADTDLDGRVEIWTDDASAAEGFEGVALDDFDFAPGVVLRFEGGQLTDVSSEFQSHFDQQIAALRAQLSSEALSDFKSSDGAALTASSLPMARRDRLRATKIKVLEIASAYLYSGREPQAWSALVDMWPAADLDRVRASLVDARTRGIRAQVSTNSSGSRRALPKKRAVVFDTPDSVEQKLVGSAATRNSDPVPNNLASYSKPDTYSVTDTMPQPILLQISPPQGAEQSLPKVDAQLDLLIDAAGKVESAKPLGKIKVDDAVMDAASRWKFIPAFKDGHAVACRLHFAVSLDQ
jgi:hypothetical protein